MNTAAPPRPALIVSQSPSETALSLLLRLLVGEADAATLAWLRADFFRWVRSDGTRPLHEFLHLGTPLQTRIGIRDMWLADAARYVEGTPWQQAKILHAEAQRFIARRWPTWRKYEKLPLGVGAPIELCLHGAMIVEPHLPGTVEGWHAITKRLAGTR